MFDYLNIVIPVYNEGDNIGDVLHELQAKVKTRHRIFIVYDSEEDTTLPVVRDFLKHQDNVIPLKNKYGRGVLNALRTGLESADTVVVVVMADLSDDIAKIDQMFAKVNGGYDIVCGSRYVKGGQQIGGPRLKVLLSRMAGLSLHYATGIPTHDATNSFKMYTQRVLDDIEIESDGGFEIGMEILVKAHFKGYRVTEVPSVWRDRTAGKSKFRLAQWFPKYLHWYFFALKCRIMSLLSGGRFRLD